MKNKEHSLKSEKGEINKISLEEDTVVHINMKAECVIYVNTFLAEKKKTEKQIWLSDLLPNYKGPSIYFDFDKDEKLIGIEILED